MPDPNVSEFLIVGAGVIGLSIARSLKKGGADRVILLERGDPGREASYAAAGMLAPQAEADADDDFFRLCRESNGLYSGLAEELLEETGVDIELDNEGTVFAAFTEKDLEEIKERFDWQSKAGLEVEFLDASDTRRLEPFVSPKTIASLFFPNDRQVENRSLVRALKEFADRNGVDIRSGKDVVAVSETSEAAKARTADGEEFESEALIISAGSWTSSIEGAGPGSGIPKVEPVRGQMVAFDSGRRLFRKVIYSCRGYIVPRQGGRVLAGSTTEHAGFDDRTTDEGIESIVARASEISSRFTDLTISDRWSGLRPRCASGKPFIGQVPGCRHTFGAVGHYRNGILLAPLTAKLMADRIINGTESPLLKAFGARPAKAGTV